MRMIWGVEARPLPAGFPYGPTITTVAEEWMLSPLLVGAIAWNETLGVADWLMATYGKTPLTVISDDGGHGLFQITTPPIPSGWQDPGTNCRDACARFISPQFKRWHDTYNLMGMDLIRCVGASFNAGWDQANAWHQQGNVDMYTTTADGIPYGQRVVNHYQALLDGRLPN